MHCDGPLPSLVALHLYSVYTSQVGLHPSPLTEFPSSQFPTAVSVPTTKPSPHTSEQVDLAPSTDVQLHPAFFLQLFEHPFESIWSPSSQIYFAFVSSLPFWQTLLQTEGSPAQEYRLSTMQLEHPSPSTSFPSSHFPNNSSPPAKIPSPHRGVHKTVFNFITWHCSPF